MSRDRLLGIVLLSIAIISGLLSRDLPWLVQGRPGAGFFPSIITSLLIIVSISMLVRPSVESTSLPTREDLLILIRALGIVTFTIVIMPYVGFLISTLVLLAIVWLSANDPISRSMRLLLVTVVVTASYTIFVMLLGMQLPKSALEF